MFRSPGKSILAAAAVALAATGCFFLAITFIASPGGNVMILGSIDATDSTWTRPSSDCTPGSGNYYYDLHLIRNATGANQRIEILAEWTDNGDGYLHLYTVPDTGEWPGLAGVEGLPGTPGIPAGLPGSNVTLNPMDGSCIAGDDDFQGLFKSLIPSQTILDGETLMVVASTFSADDAIGAYKITITTQP